jgi:hypothetical protein
VPIELVRNKATNEAFDPKAGVGAFLVRRAQHHGAILRSMPGRHRRVQSAAQSSATPKSMS